MRTTNLGREEVDLALGETSELKAFYSAACAALLRAESQGRVAERFNGKGARRWEQFAGELTKADLLDLAIRDIAVPYPIPFGLRSGLAGSSDREPGIEPTEVEGLITELEGWVEQDTDEYLKGQAELLGIRLPTGVQRASLPRPEAHHTVLECPGTGGWLSYLITSQQNSQVYYWENFCITCATWREMMLAGLIAFELASPPNLELPIILDQSMTDALGENRYDWIVGTSEGNAYRSLNSFTSKEGEVILI